MKNPDYLVMCSKCEVRIHPDDYKKHKRSCRQMMDYIPMPYPIYPVYPQPYYPPYYSPWVTLTGTTTATFGTMTVVDQFTTTDSSTYDVGTTLTSAVS